MKKLVVSLVMFASIFTSAFASDPTSIDYRVEAAFNREFAGAKAVKWEVMKKENIYQARFIYNNERLNAFFDAEGTLIATGRFVAVANLPILVRKNVIAKYKGFEIKEVIEYVTGDETSYLLALENEKSKLLVHGFHSGANYTLKKEKKNSLVKL